jgi:tRNA wybutosine-synthesizing protein 2
MKRLKQLLSEHVPGDKAEYLPSGFQRVGDIIILNLKPELKLFEKRLGQAILKTFPDAKTICARSGGISGELRIPQVRRIAGNGTVTTHIENGCKYKLDVARVMFAKGNVRERGRLPGLVGPGETIVDMFAGIGYFTVPVAVHAKPKKIIAIEKNPAAVGFLKENIKLNSIKNVDVIESDNREAGKTGIADRVILGYLPGTEHYLPAAFGFLKPDSGIIHFHNTYSKQELWDKPIDELEAAAKDAGYMLEKITHKAVVKHFAPGVEHVVIDARFSKA